MATQSRFQRIQSLFHQARSCPRGEWPDFLDRSCGDDSELRAQLDSLLQAADATGGSLEVGAVELMEIINADLDPETLTGVSIGQYRIQSVIGEGGMGMVFSAEQDHPVKRVVALKLLKTKGSPRFEAETQALALMNHPHVAKIHDAGVSPDGVPYIAMEYVEGLPLTEFCQKKNLGLRQKLKLFLELCGAIQHAHQKGIIHRDLKPSNVLVTVDAENQVLKVIDFGLALSTKGANAADGAASTPAGTLYYMSPEQLAGKDIDTRTDIYSLGLILYEILAGTTPFAPPDEVKDSAEIVRRSHDDDPFLLDRNTCEDRRRVASGFPAAEVDRELVWIVLKAIANERDRRYGTASELGADLQRYLCIEPVSVGPPRLSYRLGKFVHRNRVQMIAIGLVLLLLTAATIVTWQGLKEARVQHDWRKQVTSYLATVFRWGNPETEGDFQLTFEEILERTVDGRQEFFPENPLGAAYLRGLAGEAFRGLGKIERAEPLLRQAVETYRRYGERSKAAAVAWMNLASLQLILANLAEAENLCREVLAEPWDVASFGYELTAKSNLAQILQAKGEYDGAEKLLREVFARRRETLGESHPDTLASMNNLGKFFIDNDQPREAERLLVPCVELCDLELGQEHVLTSAARNNLASLWSNCGRPEKALTYYEEVVAARRTSLGDRHPTTARALNNLGLCYSELNRFEDAERLTKEALSIRKGVFGEDSAEVLESMNNLGFLYYKQEKIRDAERVWTKTNTGRLALLGPKNPKTLVTMMNLGAARMKLGDPESAIPLLQEVVTRRKEILPEGHRNTIEAMKGLQEALYNCGRYDEAALSIEEMVNIEKRCRASVEVILKHRLSYCQCLRRAERFDEAESGLLAIHEDAKPLGVDAEKIALKALAAYYRSRNNPERAKFYQGLDEELKTRSR